MIIPAHNEALVISSCLGTLLAHSHADEFEVIVVANGCDDGTADVVRSLHPSVICLEIAERSKVAAINRGHAAATTHPTIFLDADVQLSAEAARSLVLLLDSVQPRVGAPRLALDLSQCSWVVRTYYEFWRGLPAVNHSYVGSGVYALNSAAAKRVLPMPSVVNDDEFVRRSFTPDETLMTAHSFTIHPARNLPALIRRGVRTQRGSRQLERVAPRTASRLSSNRTRQYLTASAKNPKQWPGIVSFLFVGLLVRILSARQPDQSWEWGRDATSREGRVR
ncbi:glycosyltransferase family 2 protein [Modestobacter sp. VKM Ac-2980]|uniref:glycosyltransferase family 2 protein n=1 Tax=Modestobacter sp. VKM Ac-2980 TaxID=3004134 RepID=UPI003FA5513B